MFCDGFEPDRIQLTAFSPPKFAGLIRDITESADLCLELLAFGSSGTFKFKIWILQLMFSWSFA